jgi:hypothetical protein
MFINNPYQNLIKKDIQMKGNTKFLDCFLNKFEIDCSFLVVENQIILIQLNNKMSPIELKRTLSISISFHSLAAVLVPDSCSHFFTFFLSFFFVHLDVD